MGSIIPFPSPDEPFDDFDADDFDDRGYDGPPLDLDRNATLYTLTEVAYLLSLPCDVVWENLLDGTIPGLRVGGEWLIRRERLEAWIDGLPREGGAW